jgi:hypothetical protein
VTGQPAAVPAAQVSAVLAWAARLAAAPAGAIETAAYLTATASVLERIAAGRAAGGWTSEDITAARQAATRPPGRGRRRAAGRRRHHRHERGLTS